MRYLVILMLGVILLRGEASASVVHTNVIYGDDNRLDLFQVSDPKILELADSTLAQIPLSNITQTTRGTSILSGADFGSSYGLCREEPFFEQLTSAQCSAFLVGPDLVATAGHCARADTCSDIGYVFGYSVKTQGIPNYEVPAQDVYHCKEVVKREQTRAQDYALVRLDRRVEGHAPLKLATNSVVLAEEILVIGHPAGLPTKVAAGAKIRSKSAQFFTANLDTYGGNSGSAVFDANSHEVIGVLVRGENDFVYNSGKGCSLSNHCTNDNCRGEDSTNISFIIDAMKGV